MTLASLIVAAVAAVAVFLAAYFAWRTVLESSAAHRQAERDRRRPASESRVSPLCHALISRCSDQRIFLRVMPMARNTANSWLLRRALLKSTDPSAAIATSPRNAASTCGRVCTLRRLVNSLGRGGAEMSWERGPSADASCPADLWPFAPGAKRTASTLSSLSEPPGGIGGTTLSNSEGANQRPSSNSACTSPGNKASPTIRTRAPERPTAIVSPVPTCRSFAVAGPMAASPSPRGPRPEMRVKVIGVVVVPAIGRTEKTGAPT